MSITINSVNDVPTGGVTISGTASQGQTLTATNTLADVDGLSTITYQWKAGGTNISGATGSTYTLTQAEVGKAITVAASYTDVGNTAESVTSSATSSVVNVNDVLTGSVSISGTPTQGQTLTATNSLADADGLGTISYQWKADGVSINGATSSTLTLDQAQVGKAITVVASYTDLGNTAEGVTSSTTSSVANVNDSPTGSVTISGTATQGQVLTAANTLADADGLGTISYQWKANGLNISGATTSTLTLGQAHVGKAITVAANYIDGGNTAESVVSASTGAVVNVNDTPVATAASATTNEDTAKTGTLAGTDIDGNTLTFAKVAEPSNGTVTVNATTGAYTYTPAANYNGSDSFTFKVNDGKVDSDFATVSITVTAVNDAPIATAVSISTNEDTAKTGALTGTDVESNSLTYSKVSEPKNGTVVLNANGSYIYTPNANFSGTDTFTFKVNDATAGSTVSVLYIDSDSSTPVILEQSVENATLNQSAGNGSITGNNSNNTLNGNGFANTLSGGAGNDTITGNGGNDTIDGGEGQDTVVYASNANRYSLTSITGGYEVRDFSVLGGRAILLNIEYIRFADKTLTLETLSLKDNDKGLDSETATVSITVIAVNDAPTGSVTISGTATQSQTLTAANTLADADGLGTISYQWKADGVNISGATSSTLTLTQAHVGKAITVVANYTDLGSTAESVRSTATSAVANVNDAPTGSVTISGTATQGQSLTATNTLADADGLGTISYQWKADGVNISGATSSTLTLAQTQVGKAITVAASYTDGGNTAESVVSTATAAVQALATGSNLTGQIYQWKSHTLLSGAEVFLAGLVNPVLVNNATPLYELKNMEHSSATGVVQVGLWINLSASIKNFDLSLKNEEGQALSFTVGTTVFPTGWAVQANPDSTGGLSIAGFGDSAMTGTSVQLGTISFKLNSASQNTQINFVEGSVGGVTEIKQQTLIPYAASVRQDLSVTGVDGKYTINSLDTGTYSLDASKSLTALETGSAISSADALAALKIAVGRNPNLDGSAISPYQLIAADVNQDGKVTSADALAILKMAVKRTDAPTREWLFVSESQDFWDETANGGQGGLTISRTNVTWNKDLQATVTQDTTVNLLAVLKGDVNGSWTGATGSQSLPNPYFSDLVKKGLGPLSTWGVVAA